MMHQYEEHADCQHVNCPICDGGLSFCTVCLGAEASLTTECVGRALTQGEQVLIQQGARDFVNGAWTGVKL